MEPANKKSCLNYLEMPLIVELVSSSFGDDEQSLRIFKYFLANQTADVETPFQTFSSWTRRKTPLWRLATGASAW